MTNSNPKEARTRQYSTAAVIVTSDTCFKDPTLDTSGPFVVAELDATNLFEHVHKFLCTDDKHKIVTCLEKALTHYDPSLIITVGGTGLCPRDVTPESTSSLYDKHCSGLATALHVNNLRYTPHAAISRLTAGTIGAALVINFPGKLEACRDCLASLRPILEHALEQVRFDREAYTATHKRQLQEKLSKRGATGQAAPPTATIKSTKQIIRSPAGQSIALTTHKSLENLANKQKKFYPPRAGPRNSSANRTKSRSSSIASRMGKLSIEAIAESRSEISSLENEHQKQRQNKSANNNNNNSSNNNNNNNNSNNNGNNMPSFSPRISRPAAKKPAIAPKPGTSGANSNQPAEGLVYTPAKPAAKGPPVVASTSLPEVKILKNKSSFEVISFQESLKILSDMAANLYRESEEADLANFSKAYSCVGATLAEDLKPKRLVPAFPVSTMDGYVLHVPAALMPVIESIKTLPSSVPIVANLQEFNERAKVAHEEKKFFCYQVNTGGQLPGFNFAVIPAEKTSPGVLANTVNIEEVKPHHYVRRAGSDIGEEDIMKSGTIIGPVELSCIIAMGHRKLLVLPRPKIGVMSTGDEVEDFFSNEFMNQKSVVDMNGPMLTSLFRKLGYFVAPSEIARDNPNDLLTKIEGILKKCNVLLITGGASMGTRDHVKDVIQHMGGTIHFGRVAMKPGKPVAFASLLVEGRRKFIFSLPGNPVSAFVTTQLLVLPFLKHAAGRYLAKQQSIFDHLGEKIWAKIGKIDKSNEKYVFDGRLEFMRAKLMDKLEEFHGDAPKSVYTVDVSTGQQSSRLLSLVDCNCLIMIDTSLKGKSLTNGLIYPAIKLDTKA